MYVFHNKEHLFALLAEGATAITPNNRLSESLLKQYFSHYHHKTLDKPICLPYGVALTKAYEHLLITDHQTAHPILLNKTQCQHLWREIIKSHADITYSEGLLDSVISAWEHCQLWQIDPEHPAFYYTPQTKQFQQWWQFFNKQLKQQNLIAECQLIPYLIKAKNVLLSQPTVWVSFDDFTPQQQLLQQHMNDHGLQQYAYDLIENSITPQLFSAQDDKEEYQQLMAWLRAKIHEGHQRIGIVIPDLQQKSQTIQRILTEHFDSAQFNLSLGQSLNEFPLVAHALCWLNLDAMYLTTQQMELFLQSPYLGGAQEEFLARSEYLQDGMLMQEQSIALHSLSRELELSAPKLARLLAQITSYPQEATIHEWIRLFQERLNRIGFPGDYGLNSENYQCFNRFVLLFDELRQLAVLNTSLNKTQMLEALQHLTENTIFQAQKTNAPIQISGLLEASGCEFDSLWVMGLTDQCLPQKVHLSAFIPPQLQRELQMPHSLPARELQFAKQTLQRLQNSSNDVVFSYAQLQGDSPNLPCSLITKLSAFAPQTLEIAAMQTTELLSIEELYQVPIKPEERISGGTALLANQAKCPFKAFAEHRLRAKASSQTADGLDAKERGQIIHKVMELLWQKLGNQQKLFNLDSQILEQHIEQAIQLALAPLEQQHSASFPASIQEVEYIRLKRLTMACLEWEKQRAPFSVAALEQSYTINLAGLDFQVRVDRLDQVADKKWVIDYKSSLPSSRPWNEERPKEPQLLLYALLDTQINALLFMQLKTGKISCSGFSEEKQGISGLSSLKKEETWDDYRGNWQEQLSSLATELQQGHCPPQPVQLTICQQCDFQNLCRFQANE